jgi:hypothetical protein
MFFETIFPSFEIIIMKFKFKLKKWQCKANLPNYVRFDNISITCEGYDRVDDLYVLTGSCAVYNIYFFYSSNGIFFF